MAVNKMACEVLTQFFQNLYLDIVDSVNPDSIMDMLFSKKVLSHDDYCKLRLVPFSKDRCRDMMSLLFSSKHPQAFIYLRLALANEYPWIIDQIDKKLHPSLTAQLQQLYLGRSPDGKILLLEILVLLVNFKTLKLRTFFTLLVSDLCSSYW